MTYVVNSTAGFYNQTVFVNDVVDLGYGITQYISASAGPVNVLLDSFTPSNGGLDATLVVNANNVWTSTISGNDHVYLNANFDQLYFGNGNSTAEIYGHSEVVVLGPGAFQSPFNHFNQVYIGTSTPGAGSTVISSTANDVINDVSSLNDVFVLGAGSDYLSLGKGYEYVKAGSGFNIIADPTANFLNGTYQQIVDFHAASAFGSTYIELPIASQASAHFFDVVGGTLIAANATGGGTGYMMVYGAAASLVQSQTLFNV